MNVKVDFSDYVRLLFGLTYRKPLMLLILCVGGAMAVWVLSYHLGHPFLPDPQYIQYTALGLILVVQPLAIFLTIRRSYVSSNQLGENVRIVFEPAVIRITGSSFYTEITWAKTYKVVELRNWFMIYQNTLSAVLIPKRSFQGEQEQEFRHLMQRMPALRIRLKRRHARSGHP